MTEKDFLQTVVDFARLRGWMAYHTFDARRSAAGFPDVVLVRGTHLIFVELKGEKGRLRPEQTVWLQWLGKVLWVDTYLWRPKDILSITRTLE